jgi:hypothetical protein
LELKSDEVLEGEDEDGRKLVTVSLHFGKQLSLVVLALLFDLGETHCLVTLRLDHISMLATALTTSSLGCNSYKRQITEAARHRSISAGT